MQVVTVDLQSAGSQALQPNEASLDVGRWGEELVYHWLLNHVTATYGEGVGRVTWVNQDCNRITPYDITTE